MGTYYYNGLSRVRIGWRVLILLRLETNGCFERGDEPTGFIKCEECVD
jgi:hypothetical protein